MESKIVDRWDSDKLERKVSADFLTSYLVKRFATATSHQSPDTLTLNVRADWGFGKTFLLKRWSEDLKETGFPVVFFDAWANDFSDDPLVGFIAEMDKELSSTFKVVPVAKRHLDHALYTGRKLIKPLGMAVASALAKKLAGQSLEELSELFNSSDDSELTDDEAEQNEASESSSKKDFSKFAELALKEHLSKQQTIILFKKRLGRLIDALKSEPNVQLPLFIFVDELDRCRPTYAIELLEAIKHLFGVPGIYFVLATNLEQLGHSIKAVYGEGFDSERYLKRFFDQEYMLPTPDRRRFVSFLFNQYSLNSFGKFYSVIESGVYLNETPEETVFRLFAEAFDLSLRDQEQVALTTQSILLIWPKDERIHFAYLLFLIITKHRSTKLFRRIADNEYKDMAILVRDLESILRPDVTFRTRTRGNDSFAAPQIAEPTIRDLLISYYGYGSKTIGELHRENDNAIRFPEKIAHAITCDSPSSWSGGGNGPLSCISSYVSRVSSVGQLTIPNR